MIGKNLGGVTSDQFSIWQGTAGNRLTINTSGNVSIGNTNDSHKLDVSGLGRFTGLVDAASFTATSTSATSTFAGGLTVGTSQFAVQHATGNVGIGTPAPVAKLQITQSGDNYSDGFSLARSGASTGTMWLDASDNSFNFGRQNANNKFLTIGSSGNVSIGNTNDSYKLDVSGLGRFTGLVDAASFTATSTSATSTFAGGLRGAARDRQRRHRDARSRGQAANHSERR